MVDKVKICAMFLSILVLTKTLLGCTGCTNLSIQLEDTLRIYSEAVNKEKIDNLYLTIYFIDPHILTRKAVTVKELMNFRDVKKIVVEANEIAENAELLRKLDASLLTPVGDSSYINARIYYVITNSQGEKLLDVVINHINGPVFVNGIHVEYNTIFLTLISPFLSDADCDLIGIGHKGTVLCEP